MNKTFYLTINYIQPYGDNEVIVINTSQIQDEMYLEWRFVNEGIFTYFDKVISDRICNFVVNQPWFIDNSHFNLQLRQL